jgi:hypothetical protein
VWPLLPQSTLEAVQCVIVAVTITLWGRVWLSLLQSPGFREKGLDAAQASTIPAACVM